MVTSVARSIHAVLVTPPTTNYNLVLELHVLHWSASAQEVATPAKA